MQALTSINWIMGSNALAGKRNSRSSRSDGSNDPIHGEGNLKSMARSVRALPVRLLTVGKNRTTGVQMVVQEYMEKLQRYCSVEDVQIRSNPKKTSDVKAQIEGEDIKMLQRIMPKDWVVLLDENGNDISSEQLANIIGDTGAMGASAIVFCIGGPYGHGQRMRLRADVTIRLSSLVLNHQVALIVLLEQLYRGGGGGIYIYLEVLPFPILGVFVVLYIICFSQGDFNVENLRCFSTLQIVVN